MKKKVIGLCTLFLVLLLGCCTNSYANFDISLLEQQIDTLKTKGLITGTPKEANASQWQTIVTYSNYTDSIWHFTYDGYFIIVNNDTGEMANKLIICLHKSSNGNIVNYTNDANNSLYNMWGSYNSQFGVQTESQAFAFNLNGTNYNSGTYKYNIMNYKYVYTMFDINTRGLVLGAGEEYGGNYLFDNFEFTPASNLYINVDYNGVVESFIKLSYSRSVGSWLLGDFELPSGDLVKFTLSRFLNDEYSVSIGGAEKKGNYINNFGLGITYDNHLFVNNINVYYNQGYVLSIDVNGEFVEDYLLYFVPYGSSASSGDLISPDVDTNKDLELLQTLEELSNPSEVPTIYDNTFDKPSGELYSLLGYNDYDNPYGGWIDGLLLELKNALLGSSDVSFSFNLMKHNFTLHSSDFTTPDGPIKTFVSGFLVFGFIFYIYKTMAHLFHKLQEGNTLAAVNTVAVDDESVLM